MYCKLFMNVIKVALNINTTNMYKHFSRCLAKTLHNSAQKAPYLQHQNTHQAINFSFRNSKWVWSGIPQSQTSDKPWHRQEGPLNHHEKQGRRIKQSSQLSLRHQDWRLRINNIHRPTKAFSNIIMLSISIWIHILPLVLSDILGRDALQARM